MRKAAKLQGTPALHYFDLEAPQIASPDEKQLTWDEACTTVDQALSAAYPKLGAYFREMLAQRWIEAQPRAGKRPARVLHRITAQARGARLHDLPQAPCMTWSRWRTRSAMRWHSCALRPGALVRGELPDDRWRKRPRTSAR